ncbi:MAG: sulfatase-like hydrolase/transferase [Halioglobus sp.]
MKHPWPAALLLASALLSACSAEDMTEPESQNPPNILFILIDDLGYNDLGLNSGNAGQTPHLNAFAEQGMHFTRNYVDSTCSATRAGIMTGRPPVASGFRPSGLGISPETETLPEALKLLGYSTHHVGKWHLGYASRLAWPLSQGYDSFYGFLNQFLLRGPHEDGHLSIGRPTYFNPWLQKGDENPEQHQGHLSDLLVQQAVSFLDQAESRSEPWFLNYWTYLPHMPIEPAVRFAKAFPDTPQGRYRAMLAQIDDAIGQVLRALDRNGLDDNTMVVIASDNGGTNLQIDNNAPYFGVKASFTEGGVRTPLMIRWPDGRRKGSIQDEVVSYLDYYPTLVVAAGGQVDAELPGRDLGVLSDGGVLESRELYWEAGDSEVNVWGALSRDGRWRLQQYFHGERQLYDLEQDPTGAQDVAAKYPAEMEALSSRFLEWRKEQRELQLSFELDGPNGRGRLLGESLQRSPGFGGFSFAIGVSPGVQSSQSEQVIAAQPGHWRLSQIGGQLHLKMKDISLTTPAPQGSDCTSIIVTTHYAHRDLRPRSSEAFVELYVAGQKKAEGRKQRPGLPHDSHAKPTYVGQGAGGGSRYEGKLSMPIIYNERLFSADESDPLLGNSVAELSREVCVSPEG